MKLHPRFDIVNREKLKLSKLCCDLAGVLTPTELLRILLEEATEWSKYPLRQERHGNMEKKAGWCPKLSRDTKSGGSRAYVSRGMCVWALLTISLGAEIIGQVRPRVSGCKIGARKASTVTLRTPGTFIGDSSKDNDRLRSIPRDQISAIYLNALHLPSVSDTDGSGKVWRLARKQGRRHALAQPCWLNLRILAPTFCSEQYVTMDVDLLGGGFTHIYKMDINLNRLVGRRLRSPSEVHSHNHKVGSLLFQKLRPDGIGGLLGSSRMILRNLELSTNRTIGFNLIDHRLLERFSGQKCLLVHLLKLDPDKTSGGYRGEQSQKCDEGVALCLIERALHNSQVLPLERRHRAILGPSLVIDDSHHYWLGLCWFVATGSILCLAYGWLLGDWLLCSWLRTRLTAYPAFLVIALAFVCLFHGLRTCGWIPILIPTPSEKSVTQKYPLTSFSFCNTVIGMANVLNTDKQVAVIGALAEGSSIRSIERITGVHRDTIMRLGVRVGQGCAALLDQKMRDLPCQHLQLDEIWGFIGKKQRNLEVDDDPSMGDVWTFCAIDADTKLVPSFKVGKRDEATAGAFVGDLAGRMKNRVQISTDALRAYVGAVDQAFGIEVDYAQIVKTYLHYRGGV